MPDVREWPGWYWPALYVVVGLLVGMVVTYWEYVYDDSLGKGWRSPGRETEALQIGAAITFLYPIIAIFIPFVLPFAFALWLAKWKTKPRKPKSIGPPTTIYVKPSELGETFDKLKTY